MLYGLVGIAGLTITKKHQKTALVGEGIALLIQMVKDLPQEKKLSKKIWDKFVSTKWTTKPGGITWLNLMMSV